MMNSTGAGDVTAMVLRVSLDVLVGRLQLTLMTSERIDSEASNLIESLLSSGCGNPDLPHG